MAQPPRSNVKMSSPRPRSHHRPHDIVQQHGARRRVGQALPTGNVLGAGGGKTPRGKVHEGPHYGGDNDCYWTLITDYITLRTTTVLYDNPSLPLRKSLLAGVDDGEHNRRRQIGLSGYPGVYVHAMKQTACYDGPDVGPVDSR